VPMRAAHAVKRTLPEVTRPAPTRPFAWLGRYRRNSRDYEYYTSSSESMIRISSIHRMLRLLRPDPSKPAVPFKYRELQGIITG
jgi:putative transposase